MVWLAGALAVALLAGGGCGRQQQPESRSRFMELATAPRSDGLTRSQVRGKQLYDHYCSVCHGATGKGDGFNAYNLKNSLDVSPADLTAANAGTSREDLVRVIAGGGALTGRSPYMPPWGGTLSSVQIEDIVEYVQALRSAPAGE